MQAIGCILWESLYIQYCAARCKNAAQQKTKIRHLGSLEVETFFIHIAGAEDTDLEDEDTNRTIQVTAVII